MRFSPRRNARRDDNENEIVEALRKAGCLVWYELPVDLIVYSQQRKELMMLEVKRPKGKLTDGQRKLMKLADGQEVPIYVVRSVEDALERVLP